MNIIANRKGVLLMDDDGTYIVEDADNFTYCFDNVIEATRFWSSKVFQESYS